MKRWLTKANIFTVGIGCLLALLFCMAAFFLLRHLSAFLTFETQFAAIFSQLTEARIVPPWLLAIVVSTAAAFGVKSFARHHLWLAVLLAVVGVILLPVLTVLLTKVNGVLFGDILFSLLSVLAKGGF